MIASLAAAFLIAGNSADSAASTDSRAVGALLNEWAFIPIGMAVVVIAFLTNRFAPLKRRRIRRVVLLYGGYLALHGTAFAMHALGWTTWAERIHIFAALLQAFTLINVVGVALFDLLLPALSVELVSITSDIAVGIAYIVTTISVLSNAGMNPASVLATSAIVGGIITFSLQNTLQNVIGGIALQLDGSIHVGDWIQLENGKQGKVKEIRWRHTVVETRDWDTIIVPNASLLAGNITILGKREGEPLQHRMWVYFNVDFRYPPSRVVEVVEEALRAAPIDGVALRPPPNCIAYDFSREHKESFGYYAVRYFLTDLASDDPTSSRIRARIYAALKRAGIPLARPTQTVFTVREEREEDRLLRHREQRVHSLNGVELFDPLTDDELRHIAGRLRYAPFTAGETVTRAGAIAHWLYILISGEVEIRARVENGPTRAVAQISAPGFFGEMGLMTGEPRAADVVALTDVECYRLDKNAVEQIVVQRPEVAEEISQTLAHRRVELEAIRDGLDAEAKRAREAHEQKRILARIQDFFGLH